MVNSNKLLIKRAYLICPFFLLVILALTSFNVKAQKISKYYTSLFQQNGNLYHIKPKHELSNKASKNKMQYDITYHTANDSVIINYTLSDPTLVKIDSISFISDTQIITNNSKKLFVEANKKKVVSPLFYNLFI